MEPIQIYGKRDKGDVDNLYSVCQTSSFSTESNLEGERNIAPNLVTKLGKRLHSILILTAWYNSEGETHRSRGKETEGQGDGFIHHKYFQPVAISLSHHSNKYMIHKYSY